MQLPVLSPSRMGRDYVLPPQEERRSVHLQEDATKTGTHGGPYSCTSQISDSNGGSFLSWSRNAKTCSECTELRVRRLTSFMSIRGKRSWSCRGKRRRYVLLGALPRQTS